MTYCYTLLLKTVSDITHIIDNIYLGNFESANDHKIIKKHKIGVIVRILDTEMITILKHEDTEPDITYHYIDIYDHPGQNIQKFFSSFLKFLKKHKEKNILIHCLMGISRSPSFVILHLVKNYQLNLIDAIKYVKKQRPCIKPLKEFIYQIADF